MSRVGPAARRANPRVTPIACEQLRVSALAAIALSGALSACDDRQPPSGLPDPPSSSQAVTSATASGGVLASGSASASSSSATDEATEAAQVRRVFLNYKKAVYERDGERAASLVTQSTHAYYESMRKHAVHTPRAELRKLPVMDRLVVLVLRHRMAGLGLAKLEGRDVFVASVREGLVGDSGRDVEPDDVVLEGEVARLGLRVGQAKTPPSSGFRLVREGGAFRLDVMSLQGVAAAALEQGVAKLDPDPEVALLKLVEASSGTRPPASIWEPLEARQRAGGPSVR